VCAIKKSFECPFILKTPLIGGFVEKQHEIICPAWSGKTTEGLVSPSDYHKTARIVSYEEAFYTTYHLFLI